MHGGRTLRAGGGLLAAGGVLWLAKLTVIAATDGRVTDTGAAAAFYLFGLAALVIGAAVVGFALTAARPLAVRIGAAVLAPLLFAGVSLTLLDAAARALVPDGSAAWVSDEAGIFAAAVVALLVGALLVTRGRHPVEAAAGHPG